MSKQQFLDYTSAARFYNPVHSSIVPTELFVRSDLSFNVS